METFRKRYKQAYHRIRTLNSRQLIWEADTYPVGFNCPNERECSRGRVACGCLLDDQARHTAHLETVKEANRLITDIDNFMLPFAAKALAERLEFLDFEGRDHVRAINPSLRLKLRAATKKGYRFS